MNLTEPARHIAARGLAEILPKLTDFGGRPGLVRALEPGDQHPLQEFFRSHTPETIHERYGYLISAMTDERAKKLVGVDQARDCALGIFESLPDGEQLHAVGRYCLDPNGHSAELAFVVRESMRQAGMATTLLRRLIQVARQRELSRVWAQMSPQNADMISIFRREGFTFVTHADVPTTIATLELR